MGSTEYETFTNSLSKNVKTQSRKVTFSSNHKSYIQIQGTGNSILKYQW